MNQIPVEFNSDTRCFRDGYHTISIDGQQTFHRELEVLFWNEILKPFAVTDGTRDVQVDDVHVVHGRGMYFAVYAETLSQMCYLQRTRDATFP